MSNNDLLKNWVKRIENVYDLIAKKINALVVLLNEASGKETDPETKALAENILRALRDFEKSELAEVDLAKKTLGKEKAKEVLASLHRQITEIKRIGGFIYLSRKNPQPKVITAINDLAQKIKNELLREEKEL